MVDAQAEFSSLPDTARFIKTSRIHRWRLAIGCIAAATVLAGCVTTGTGPDDEPLERDLSATATLDHAHGIINTPIRRYGTPVRLIAKSSLADDATVYQCMRDKGFKPQLPKLTARISNSNSNISHFDFFWLVWSVEVARKNGYQIGENVTPSSSDIPDTPGYAEADLSCREEHKEALNELTKGLPFASEENPNMYSIADRLEAQAVAATEDTDEYKALHEQFNVCLRGKGYTPANEKTGGVWGAEGVTMSSTEKPNAEEIKAAVAEAHCFSDTQIIQKIGNIKASFEVPLIKKHQAELDARLQEIEEIETRLDAHIKKNS